MLPRPLLLRCRLRRAVVVGGASLWALSCLLPSESGKDYRVEFSATAPPLFVGDSAPLAAVVRDEAGNAVDGIAVRFLSADPEVVDVDARTGLVRARAEGRTAVRAYAPDWPNIQAAKDSVVVQPGIPAGVRELYPDTVAIGDTVTLVGSGLDPAQVVSLTIGKVTYAPADLVKRYGASGDGLNDTLVIWIPPAPPQTEIILLRQDARTALLPVWVLQQDILEPNSPTPRLLPDSFWNPALALESPAWFDRYRVVQNQGAAITVAVEGDAAYPPVLRVVREGSASGVVMGGETVECEGREVSLGPLVVQPTAHRVAVEGAAIDDTLLLEVRGSHGAAPVRYALRLAPGHALPVGADAAEGNDFCEDAYPVPVVNDTTLALTFDGTPDYDWFKLQVGAGEIREMTLTAAAEGGPVPEVWLFEGTPTPGLQVVAGAAPRSPGAEPLPPVSERILLPGDHWVLVTNASMPAAVATGAYELRVTSRVRTVAAVDIPRDTIVMAFGESRTLPVTAWDSNGDSVPGVVRWRPSGNPAVVSVTLGGVANGEPKAGKVWVDAVLTTDSTVRDSVLIWVTRATDVLSVWGFAPDDVWATTDNGFCGTNCPLVARFDGTRWSWGWFTTSEQDPIGFGIHGSSPEDVWVVGEILLPDWWYASWYHYDGLDWQQDTVAPRQLTDVWAFSPSDVWAVGIRSLILHFDGTAWTDLKDVAVAAGISDNTALFGVWGSDSGSVWVVGAGEWDEDAPPVILEFDAADPARAPVVHRDGVTSLGSMLTSVFGADPNNVWAVSATGEVLKFDGTGWGSSGSDPGWYYDDVWVSPSGHVWIVGDSDGKAGIRRYAGGEVQEWTGVETPELGPYHLNSVWGSSSSDVWAVGSSGVILHFDGVEWRRVGWEP